MNTYEVLEIIKLWVQKQSNKPCLINVAGASCSGKSFFSKQLQNFLSEKSVILQIDDYFRDINDPYLPHDKDGLPVFDEPTSYHRDEIQETIASLLENRCVFIPIYNIARNKRMDAERPLHPEPVIIADGLFSITFLDGFQPSLNIFVEADQETCIRRRVERDATRFDIPETIIRDHYLQKIIPRQIKYLDPQKSLANYLVIST